MELDADVEHHLEDHFAWEREHLATRQAELRHIFGLCRTPLQQRFLWQFLGHSGVPEYRPSDYRGWHIVFPQYGDPHYYGLLLDLFPRYAIELPNTAAPEYHADFLFVLRRWDWDAEGGYVDVLHLVVEIDERAGDERTPEQAQHDRTRDRFMAARGWEVLRFTAREVRDTLDAPALSRSDGGVVWRVVDFIGARMAATVGDSRAN